MTDGGENVRFTNNTILGVKFGISPQNVFSVLGGEQEFYLGNTFKCESWLRTGLALASRVAISGNVPSMNTAMSAVVTGSDTTYWKPSRIISKDGTAASGTAPLNLSFRVDKTCFVIGYRVTLRNWSSQEAVTLIVANVNNGLAIAAAGSGSSTVTEARTHLYALTAGTTYPLYLKTQTNSLTAASYTVEVFILE